MLCFIAEDTNNFEKMDSDDDYLQDNFIGKDYLFYPRFLSYLPNAWLMVWTTRYHNIYLTNKKFIS